MKIYDTAVIGGGLAGYAAALTAKNLLLDYLWLGEEGFGKIRSAQAVRNFPAVTGSGETFSSMLFAQMGAEKLRLTPLRADGVFAVGDGYSITAGGETFSARTVILATGVESRDLLRGEREFLGRGVSYCAVCDGALYRGKRIAALLSSPKFAEEVRFLARFASRVYYDCPAPLKFTEENIERLPARPVALGGGSRVENLILPEGQMEIDGVFFLKESAPPESLAFGVRTEGGHICVNRAMETNLKGLFAAGDVTGRPYQYAKAAGEGCVAAHSAWEYLKKLAEN